MGEQSHLHVPTVRTQQRRVGSVQTETGGATSTYTWPATKPWLDNYRIPEDTTKWPALAHECCPMFNTYKFISRKTGPIPTVTELQSQRNLEITKLGGHYFEIINFSYKL